MSKRVLTDLAIKNLRPKERPYKVSDGSIGGFFVAVAVSGKKVFRLAFKFEGKAQQLTLCPYPEFSLAEARQMAQKAKNKLARGINPAAQKQAEKANLKTKQITFSAVAHDWFNMRKPTWSKGHTKDTFQKLNLHVLPRIGELPITKVTKEDIKTILDSLHTQGKFATLKKIESIISQILCYAIESDFPETVFDWTTQLSKLYSHPKPKHRAALTKTTDIQNLMESIESYEQTSLQTFLALKFSALTFCRPGEIRHAEWAEIDFEEQIWTIPASKMKMGIEHKVPLAQQALDILAKLKILTGHTKFLFPSVRTTERPMSEATINAAIRRMGYTKEQMCAHGFRGMASTKLNEQGYNRDWIECQLAHSPQDKIRSAYNHAEYLTERREMMQKWADFLFPQEAQGK